jgi:hypothetical protein
MICIFIFGHSVMVCVVAVVVVVAVAAVVAAAAAVVVVAITAIHGSSATIIWPVVPAPDDR